MAQQKQVDTELVMGWESRKRLQAKGFTNKQGQIFRAMAPVLDQEGLITPTPASYVVQHFDVPAVMRPEDWTLTINGHVNQLVTLTYDDLRELPGRTVRMVMECSGNDAQFFDAQYAERFIGLMRYLDPTYDGKRWQGGLISAGEFTGAPLASVLEKAGLKPNAVNVRVEGTDRGSPDLVMHGLPPSDTPVPLFNYDKGLPMEKALHPDTILAWAQNGEALDHVHGAPVRLVVPGWPGNWSVKWVQRIDVLDKPATCWYQTEYYYYSQAADDPEREIITTLPVKSMITFPKDDDPTLPRGRHVLRGFAWSGAGMITRVEVSVDDGKTWRAAHLEEPREKWLWARWSLPWDFPEPGTYSILCRATDEAGRIQSREARWNYLRKNFNGIVPVQVTIA
jgi:DMSO/TMAO reductase YedYZ molybdopterin-dependent catalytic subunit